MKKFSFIILLLTLASCSNNASSSNNLSITSTSSSSVSIETCDNHFDCLTDISLGNIVEIKYTYNNISAILSIDENYHSDFFNDINVEYQTIDNLYVTDNILDSNDTCIFEIGYLIDEEEKTLEILYNQNKIYFGNYDDIAYVSIGDILLEEKYFIK